MYANQLLQSRCALALVNGDGLASSRQDHSHAYTAVA